MKKDYSKKLLLPGHNACAGCGQLVAVQAVMRGLNENTIVSNATGCLEVTSSSRNQSAWNIPWIHTLFESSAPVASGILAALKKQKIKNMPTVVVQAGDGGTFDIGFGQVSGMWERNERILYICYDTEAYSNTGIQASGATPYGASTTTTPNGEKSIGSTQTKKDMIGVALAHGLKYIAQSTAGFPDDITRKVKTALEIDGPTYIQILSPCMPGWKIGTDEGVSMGKLAAETGLYPLLEYREGKLVSSNIKTGFIAKPVTDYLKTQGRFKHLKEEDLQTIQKIANENIVRYQQK
ncbi:MAG: thiamine pyrophosphate-dependent enzyme [Candidatus Falkowbacteria bacterium]|nr:thiamine pyrophosphate-dependent enzyme [Candidatus Falkowbacteria bacterium]